MSAGAANSGPESTWKPAWETPPSMLRPEEPRLARWVGSIGLVLVALAAFALLFQAWGGTSRLGPGLRIFLFAVGMAGLLFHASREPDLQLRRTYGLAGVLFLVIAGVLAAITVDGKPAALFMPYGLLCLPLALLFFLAYVHNETEEPWRRPIVMVTGALAITLAGISFVGGNVSPVFLVRYGVLFGLIGLAYAWAFIAMHGADSEIGYRTGQAVGVVGLVIFLTALGRSLAPALVRLFSRTPPRAEESYFATAGLLLMGLGFLYVCLSAGLTSDNRFIVLTRRELAAFFYSPIGYIVFFGWTVVGVYMFFLFVANMVHWADRGSPMIEPIVQYYVIDFTPIVGIIFVVPILTMRLLSDEKRTGTLEVLLTAPLGETAIVLSKFFAALIFFLLLWLPWGLFLIALYLESGQAFDYRPLLSFSIALVASGAGFIAMGVFFSSLTRNQIAAAILTFMGMMVLISIFFVIRMVPAGPMRTFLIQTSFINLWQSTLEGRLVIRDILFPVSAAVFWLFLTVKVLEARKWS
jgi:ABC-type transport system involved in multi-copper enzyme maturation permease subunit